MKLNFNFCFVLLHSVRITYGRQQGIHDWHIHLLLKCQNWRGNNTDGDAIRIIDWCAAILK